MPQSANPVTIATKSGVQSSAMLDATNNLIIGKGTSSALNKTVAAAIKATPGRVCKVIVVNGGITSGAFTINDCATTGAATAANTIWSLPFGAAAGTVYDLDFPCAVGITLSAVPAGGTPIVSISYT